MLQPALGGVLLGEAVCVRGGLVNSVYHVSVRDSGEVYALRVYAAEGDAMKRECGLLHSLRDALPVPQVLFADASGAYCTHPYLIYPWIEGITLNEWRRQSPSETLLCIAAPLGSLLAQVARAAFPSDCISRRMQVSRLLEQSEEQLRGGLARKRLGGALADAMLGCFKASSSTLRALDNRSGLVHGDFGGRNILVKASERGAWEISGLIDWEQAAVGSPLWDVGSLFRYSSRYSEKFRALFERGYSEAGGSLPSGWWLAARMIDAVQLVSILNEERELPGVFAECADLIQSIVADAPGRMTAA